MTNDLKWSRSEMIEECCREWGDDTGRDFAPEDCTVVESTGDHDEPCLIVLHRPSGRTSDEWGDGGMWHLDGSIYAGE
jgi:hypothetical protein